MFAMDINDCSWDGHSLQVQLAQVTTEHGAQKTAENHAIWAKNSEWCQGKKLPECISDLYKLDSIALSAMRWLPAPAWALAPRCLYGFDEVQYEIRSFKENGLAMQLK